MTLKQRVGLRIKTVRERRGLTQAALGEHIGRSADAVSQIERGINVPRLETLEKMADCLDVSISTFFEVDEVSISPKRTVMVTTMLDIARRLSEADLKVAVAQLVALEEARRD